MENPQESRLFLRIQFRSANKFFAKTGIRVIALSVGTPFPLDYFPAKRNVRIRVSPL